MGAEASRLAAQNLETIAQQQQQLQAASKPSQLFDRQGAARPTPASNKRPFL